jgi:hypothetical protein
MGRVVNRTTFWRTALPSAVLALGGLVLLSLFAGAGHERAFAGYNDFLSFYAGGRLAFSGHLYDPERVLAEQQRAGGVSGENLHFIRPPWFAAILWPLSRLSYWPAYVLWEVLAAAAIGLFAVWWSPPGVGGNVLALCWSLPALSALLAGQDVPFLAAEMALAALLSRRGQPFAAGMVLALTQAKFHLFLPLWPIFILARRWRLVSGMAAGNAALVLASCAAAGWRWPIEYLAAIQRDAVTPGIEHMPTFFHALHGLGPYWPVLVPLAPMSVAIWFAPRRLTAELAIAAAPAMMIPFVSHTYLFDGIVLLPLLVSTLSAESKPARIAAMALLTPIPWAACLVGYPWSLFAPLLVVALLALQLSSTSPEGSSSPNTRPIAPRSSRFSASRSIAG